MLKHKTLGIIFSNMHEAGISELTSNRLMASIPVLGRYRMIDFYLSSFVDSGITQVGIITKSNYQSLMDHIGSGRDWDLSRRNGVTILPPFSYTAASEGSYHGRIAGLYGIMNYLEKANAEYVVICDTDHICTLNFEEIVENHIASGADYTFVCRKPDPREDHTRNCVMFHAGESGIADGMELNDNPEGYVQSMNVIVCQKQLLIDMVNKSMAKREFRFEQECVAKHFDDLKINVYQYKGFVRRITDLRSYYKISLDLIDDDKVAELMGPRPIFTKIHDSPPTRYGLDCDVKTALIADGCTIEGTVENSILFRGVKVGKGAVVRDSIIFQDTVIEDNADVEMTITDKEVVISEGKTVKGKMTHPAFIEKYGRI